LGYIFSSLLEVSSLPSARHRRATYAFGSNYRNKFLLFATTPGFAEDPDAVCNATLLLETTKFVSQLDMRLSILKTIKEDTYEEAKKNGSLNFVLPYLGLMTDAKYDEFNQKRNNYLNEYKFELDEKRSLDYYSSRVPDNTVKNYLNCITRDKRGLFLAFADVIPTELTLRILWKAPQGVGTIHMPRDGAKIYNATPGERVKQTWKPGGDGQSIHLTKRPIDLPRVTMNLDVFNADIAVIPTPNIREILYKWVEIGPGDCGNRDYSCSPPHTSATGAIPDDAACDKARSGQITAVCFPGINPFVLRGCQGPNWCVYKSYKPEECIADKTGGAFPGARRHACSPKEAPLDEKTLSEQRREFQRAVKH
jgi:hypothetical protein